MLMKHDYEYLYSTKVPTCHVITQLTGSDRVDVYECANCVSRVTLPYLQALDNNAFPKDCQNNKRVISKNSPNSRIFYPNRPGLE